MKNSPIIPDDLHAIRRTPILCLIVLALICATSLCCGTAMALKCTINKIASGHIPGIACDVGGALYVVYVTGRDASAPRHVMFVKSSDQGKNWSTPQDLATVGGDIEHTSIAATKGLVSVYWIERGPDQKKAIAFLRSSDCGNSWSSVMYVAPGAGPFQDARLAFAADGSIHAVWSASSAGKTGIAYSVSKDSGRTFSPAVSIGSPEHCGLSPSVIVSDKGVVHIVWVDHDQLHNHFDVLYRKSADGFSALAKSNVYKLSTDIAGDNKTSCSILAPPVLALGRGGRVLITWSDNSQRQNGADVWCVVDEKGKISTPSNISATAGISSAVSIASDTHGAVGAFWSDTSYGTPQIFGRLSRDDLENASYALEISAKGDTPACKSPAIAVNHDHAFVIWEQEMMPESQINLKSLPLQTIGTGACFDITLKSAKNRRVQF